MSNSTIKRLVISNIGPFGRNPTSIEISDLVCLVGQNNCGKSTVLDCYELAIKSSSIPADKIHKGAEDDPYVELWIEVAEKTPNIADKWLINDYAEYPGTPIIRSRWTWSRKTLSCERTTYDKETNSFPTEEKASGLDSVFSSRLPKPLRIGALDQPDKEKSSLIKLILEPIIKDLKNKIADDTSNLSKALSAFKDTMDQELIGYADTLKEIQNEIDGQFTNVFNDSNVSVTITPNKDFFDLDSYLTRISDILIKEEDRFFKINSQGTGAQRTLFWSLLKVRSALQSKLDTNNQKEKRSHDLSEAKRQLSVLQNKENLTSTDKKKITALTSKVSVLENTTDETFNRGYVLMIDEPEIALHPSAVRAAKDQLYKLSQDSGWQVMMTTHHPAFIDPTKDHTTIVRVEKRSSTSHTFRSTAANFNESEKNQLSALLKFDSNFSEIFFANTVFVVEGDTEYALFQELIDTTVLSTTPKKGRTVIRAGGKSTIPLILRILRQFKIPHSILHDTDSPKTKSGKKKNPAYVINKQIAEETKLTTNENIKVIHRVSVPNFEVENDIPSSGEGKPLDAVLMLSNTPFKNAIETLIKELSGEIQNTKCGDKYEDHLKSWIEKNNLEKDPRFIFTP
ncbi:ATP-dependent nuclease [Pseudobdellovibrio exovorus]|uniref:Uncharacterized protein n=1 Tax=Pseudobdellovibrio exovorus JSS TaxID=1184267 RepID=M4VQG1_9BACT|nr:AAA family ATPase [Pseudobdellovibrio exovorus]AGH95394.1 hypothetical protein A11Q_1178 [Pseudobdellovibrio exovorus JSS]